MILGDQAYSQIVTHRLNKIPEPTQWLWRQAVAPARAQLQVVELEQQGFGTAPLVGQSLSFGALDFALNAAFMQIAE